MARLILVGLGVAAGCFLTISSLRAQNDPGDWPMYNRDLAGTRFSPLHQIDASNVGALKQAWSYNLGTASGNQAGSEFTPIVVNGVLYLAAFHYVTALDPETGKPLWHVTGPAEVTANTLAFSATTVFSSGGFPEKELRAIRGDGAVE